MKNKAIFLVVMLLMVSLGLNFYFFQSLGNPSWTPNVQMNDQTTESSFADGILPASFVATLDTHENNIENINVFSHMQNAFSSVNTKEDFQKFDETYNGVYYFILTGKRGDKENWEKYSRLMLESANEYTPENFAKLQEIFTKIQNKDPIIPVENSDLDIEYFFNSSSADETPKWCEKLSKVDEYYQDQVSCSDKIYLYKSTKENNLCEKISDKYKQKLCTDFLKISN